MGATNTGLRPRIPFYEQVVLVDKRVQTVEMEQQQVLSTDQLRLQVDAFALFRIVDPRQMIESVGQAQPVDRVKDALRPILGSALRNELGKREFVALLSPERGAVMNNIQARLDGAARQYGAEIVDVRINRADLPSGTPLDSAFERMRSARAEKARTIEAQGRKVAADHTRDRRRAGREHLCGGVQQGSVLLRLLPRHAELSADIPVAGERVGHGKRAPVAGQRISAAVPGSKGAVIADRRHSMAVQRADSTRLSATGTPEARFASTFEDARFS